MSRVDDMENGWRCQSPDTAWALLAGIATAEHGARNRMPLAEFDYQLKPRPSFPFLNTTNPRYDMWLLKRYGLPALYWHGMLRGRA